MKVRDWEGVAWVWRWEEEEQQHLQGAMGLGRPLAFPCGVDTVNIKSNITP